jgi:hypothetical protein
MDKRAWVWLLLPGLLVSPAQARTGDIVGVCVTHYYNVVGGDTPDGKPVQAKLNSIVLHGFAFKNEDIAQVLKDLSAQSQRLDPDHIGVKMRLDLSRPPESKIHPPIRRNVNMGLDDPVCLGEALAYICEEANLGYRIVDGVVVMEPAW